MSLAANGGTAPSDTRTRSFFARFPGSSVWACTARLQWAGCAGVCAVDLLIARGDHPHSET